MNTGSRFPLLALLALPRLGIVVTLHQQTNDFKVYNKVYFDAGRLTFVIHELYCSVRSRLAMIAKWTPLTSLLLQLYLAQQQSLKSGHKH